MWAQSATPLRRQFWRTRLHLRWAGFEANLADFVSLSGDLAYKKQAGNIIAIGTNVAAMLEVDSASVSLSDASFGLQTSDSGTVFELKGGTFAASISGLSTVTAASTIRGHCECDGRY